MAAGDRTHPSETVTRKPDDDVGKSGSAPTGGGRQTSEQAAITGLGSSGRSDADRDDSWNGGGGQAGRNPAPVGGASQGHADQKAAGDRDDEKSAQGHYKIEKERG